MTFITREGSVYFIFYIIGAIRQLNKTQYSSSYQSASHSLTGSQSLEKLPWEGTKKIRYRATKAEAFNLERAFRVGKKDLLHGWPTPHTSLLANSPFSCQCLLSSVQSALAMHWSSTESLRNNIYNFSPGKTLLWAKVFVCQSPWSYDASESLQIQIGNSLWCNFFLKPGSCILTGECNRGSSASY